MRSRKAAFAGSWYPDKADACEREIKQFLASSKAVSLSGVQSLGGIVPHAGWYYSGAVACEVIAGLRKGPEPDLIVVFGMHLHKNSSAYIMKAGAWETPFGDLEIDQEVAEAIADKYQFKIDTASHFTPDNTIELQLPFIKYFFKNTKIVPLGVPPTKQSLAMGKELATIATDLGRKTKIIGSTDLTHYGFNYGFTPKGTGAAAHEWVRNENDRYVIDQMVQMDAEGVMASAEKRQNACCPGAAATALVALKTLGADTGQILTYATSYEKSPGDSFVGYVGIVF